jgi:YfiH family protein
MSIAEALNSCILNKNEWIYKNVGGLPLIFSPLLSEFPSLKHAFTTRLGGESAPPQDSFNLGRKGRSDEASADALNNRHKLCDALGISKQVLVPGQVHSAAVVFTDSVASHPEVDGACVNRSNLPVLLHFADCVPVIVFDPIKGALSVVHAGWRGTVGKIALVAVETLVRECGSKPKDLVAAVGPAIGSCCYPTGPDVIEQLKNSLTGMPNGVTEAEFAALFVEREGAVHPDLKAINAAQLRQAGVERIDTTNLCTACNPKLFYSHRQSGGQTGRQGAIACIV